MLGNAAPAEEISFNAETSTPKNFVKVFFSSFFCLVDNLQFYTLTLKFYISLSLSLTLTHTHSCSLANINKSTPKLYTNKTVQFRI